MKIGPSPDHPTPKPVTTGAQAPSDATRAAAATASASAPAAANLPANDANGNASASASATIALSSTAASLLSSGVNAEFDAEKVASISAAIDNGSFKINPEAIADKLISNAQELLTQAKA